MTRAWFALLLVGACAAPPPQTQTASAPEAAFPDDFCGTHLRQTTYRV